MHTLTVRKGLAVDKAVWERFVEEHPHSTFFHRWGWSQVIADTYGHEPYYLIAEQGRHVVGILPMIYVKSAIAGCALISTAFTVGGGVLARDEVIERALLDEAVRFGQDLQVDTIELRDNRPVSDGWITKKPTHAGFCKTIPRDQEALLKAIPRKRRAELRKAFALVEDGKLSAVIDNNPDRFYPLYARSLRDLGTPVLPKTFIGKLMEQFLDDLDIITIEYEGKAVTSLLSFYHRDHMLPYYVGALPQARALRAFDFVYWQQMLTGLERGCHIFDFGRSRIDSGPYGYKKTWGFEPELLTLRVHLVKADAMPDISPENSKFALATKIWKRLPVPIATLGGAILARHFG